MEKRARGGGRVKGLKSSGRSWHGSSIVQGLVCGVVWVFLIPGIGYEDEEFAFSVLKLDR